MKVFMGTRKGVREDSVASARSSIWRAMVLWEPSMIFLLEVVLSGWSGARLQGMPLHCNEDPPYVRQIDLKNFDGGWNVEDHIKRLLKVGPMPPVDVSFEDTMKKLKGYVRTKQLSPEDVVSSLSQRSHGGDGGGDDRSHITTQRQTHTTGTYDVGGDKAGQFRGDYSRLSGLALDHSRDRHRSDSKYSDMFKEFESGGASGSGGCGDDEESGDDEDDDGER
ncbi:hypothetical protein Tco_0885630 [Tanacetum coccineum]